MLNTTNMLYVNYNSIKMIDLELEARINLRIVYLPLDIEK